MNIRNFCIIAHIDHGKSTLADRFLEFTNTVSKNAMQAQFLDMHPLERERGITIKMQPVRMNYKTSDGSEYVMNLIDTPGHSDFVYEVSRSLSSVEGAILLVDATQGVQAQTITNLYLAKKYNLAIIPVVNKIDSELADIDSSVAAIKSIVGCKDEDIILASGKTGVGVDKILASVIDRVRPPVDNKSQPLKVLVFDSHFDDYKGIVLSVRVLDGIVKQQSSLCALSTGLTFSALEVGVFNPFLKKTDSLSAGEIGYIATGLKTIEQTLVGDTITELSASGSHANIVPFPGYQAMKPVVFAGLFAKDGNDYSRLKDSIYKLKLNDASLMIESENSASLGFGFRCGFLGVLHLEIVQERLTRDYGMDIIITYPSVAYQVKLRNNDTKFIIKNPMELTETMAIESLEEPFVNMQIIAYEKHLGNLLQLVIDKKGEYQDIEYISNQNTPGITDRLLIIHCQMPLASILIDFYDKLKSITSGYGSLNYEIIGYRLVDAVRLDIMVSGKIIEALSSIVYQKDVYNISRNRVASLKDNLKPQMFVIKIQAMVRGKIIASESISALRKDVTAKLYGGDYTRKLKLLEKQKKGKKKMMSRGVGSVDIPQEAFMAIFKV